MDPIFTQQLNMPQGTAPSGGMFGNGKFGIAQAISAALNGYLAGMPGPSQQVGLAGIKALQERQQMALEEQVYEHRQNLQMQREMAMLPLQAQLKLMYPDNAFAQEAYQSGIRPGTPEWTKAMQTRVNNELDPVISMPGGGMTTRSAITGAGQPAPAGVTFTPIDAPQAAGGQTQPASGGFLGAPFSNVGPYSRY